MACGCENRKMAGEIERIERLAKALAVIEQTTVAVYRKEDGTYGFTAQIDQIDKPIVEYISQY